MTGAVLRGAAFAGDVTDAAAEACVEGFFADLAAGLADALAVVAGTASVVCLASEGACALRAEGAGFGADLEADTDFDAALAGALAGALAAAALGAAALGAADASGAAIWVAAGLAFFAGAVCAEGLAATSTTGAGAVFGSVVTLALGAGDFAGLEATGLEGTALETAAMGAPDVGVLAEAVDVSLRDFPEAGFTAAGFAAGVEEGLEVGLEESFAEVLGALAFDGTWVRAEAASALISSWVTLAGSRRALAAILLTSAPVTSLFAIKASESASRRRPMERIT